MLSVGVGHSADIDLDRAVAEVIEWSRAGLDGVAPRCGLLFVADSLDLAAVLKGLRRAFPGVPLVGCTSGGEASSGLGFQDDSILLILFGSADLVAATALGRAPSEDPEGAAAEAHAEIGRQLGGVPPRLCFMFSDALHADPGFVLRALNDLFGDSVPIVGGAAACYPPGPETRVIFGDEGLREGVVLLALGGSLDVAIATENSWQPIGKPGRITDSSGKTVYRINDQPALDFYHSMLGPEARTFLGAPLAIIERQGGISVRSPMTVDEETRSLEVSGGIPEGETVQLAFATYDDVQQGADAVAERTLAQFPQGRDPALLFFCSCGARKMFLALDVRTECDQLQRKVGAGIPVAGFYGFGEIGGATTEAPPRFHNQAIVSIAIG
ncbi:FIST signal transduction protein [Pelagibius sp.]|uniref:FIST signal transduction protein n=1 Tax=Pelagibius sp. TaxID=1931238 RepID=UPI00260704F3|nr:FIST N-terminal domain-containing protein [Pelagibius sp.]